MNSHIFPPFVKELTLGFVFVEAAKRKAACNWRFYRCPALTGENALTYRIYNKPNLFSFLKWAGEFPQKLFVTSSRELTPVFNHLHSGLTSEQDQFSVRRIR